MKIIIYILFIKHYFMKLTISIKNYKIIADPWE